MTLCSVDTPLCTQFLSAKISNICNVASPEFIQYRLKSAGVKAINLCVDVTNYVCLDLGQPLHVYDSKKVNGVLKICQTEVGQKLETLDGKIISLGLSDIVICDNSGPIGLAGIMGGLSTAVSDVTNSVILEAAVFDSVAIAQSGQHHNIISNSRARFERGIDSTMTEIAFQKAIDLIVTYGGGVVETTDGYKMPIERHIINWNPELMKNRTGVSLFQEEMEDIFKRIGCSISENKVTVPTWRHDLQIPEDLVEELLRIKGYDALPVTSLPPKVCTPQIKTYFDLSGLGLHECVTLSFTTHQKAALFSDTLVDIGNPISQDLSTMKPSLLCGLLDTAKHNLSYGQDLGVFYEAGKSYAPGEEMPMIAGLRYGNFSDRTWYATSRAVDVFDAKADCLKTFELLGLSENKVQLTRDIPRYYHPKQAGCFKQGKKILGYFGAIHPSVLKTYDIKKSCVGFEIFLDNVPATEFKSKPFAISDLPKTRLDLSFIVDVLQETGVICQMIGKTPMVQDVSVFDVYTGQGVPDGKKAVAVQFVVQPTEKNLTDTEIKNLMQQIVQTINTKFDAKLRD